MLDSFSLGGALYMKQVTAKENQIFASNWNSLITGGMVHKTF